MKSAVYFKAENISYLCQMTDTMVYYEIKGILFWQTDVV